MIIPEINSTCSYQFTTNFASLDGIYTLVDISSYNEAIAEGVNFIADLYTLAGQSSTQFTTDSANYVNDTVLHLLPANSNQVPLYAPSSVLSSVPDPMVGCYNNLAIGVSLGLFKDKAALAWVINELNQILGSVIGTTNPVQLYSLGTEYMRITDFDALQATRNATKVPYATIYQQLQQQIALTKVAQNLNQYYEATLVALNTPMSS